MDMSLLKVKIQVPPIRQDLVPRCRLIDHLNRGLYNNDSFTRRLTLVSAPAGYGKSTLVRQWAAQFEQRAAWVSLDEGDNNPALFWSYFVSSLQRVEKNLGNSILAYLKTISFLPGESTADNLALPERLLIALINELAELQSPIMIVLDDFQLISENHIMDRVAFLIDNLPCKAHLVIVTRQDPPWPLSRWRSRSVMAELRHTNLLFSDKEAGEFLKHAMHLDLSLKEISTLTSRTEGWITGLQMAAVSMRESRDFHGFIENFTGSSRYILDYLSEEVLQSQPKDIQAFLLKTSILKNLTAELCDTVTGCGNGQYYLETLERANLFIISLDDERRWYRYHHLFASLLRHKLACTSPELLRQLHLMALGWYRRMGMYVEAIEHAYAAEDFDAAAGLIDEGGDFLLHNAEYIRLLRWLNRLPQKEFEKRPQLFVLNALLMIRDSRLSEAEECLQRLDKIMVDFIEGTYGEDNEKIEYLDHLWAKASTLHAFLSLLSGDTKGVCRYSVEALKAFPHENTLWRCGALIASGDAHYIQSDLEGANRAYQSALTAGKSLKNPFIIYFAGQKIGLNLWNQGRLNDTVELCCSLLRFTEENNLACTGRGGTLWSLWGDVLRERNQMEEAKIYVQRGYELSQTESMARGWCGYCLMRLQLSLGDYEDAEKTFEELVPLMKQSALLSALMSTLKAKILLAKNDLSSAAGWVRERGISPDEKYSPVKGPEYLAAARIMAAEGRLEEADTLLEKICSFGRDIAGQGILIETLAVKALTYKALGKAEKSHTMLCRALILAEPEGYTRIFLDEGLPMANLLKDTAVGQEISAYGKRLLKLFDNSGDKEDAGVNCSNDNYVEALSERELEILTLVAQGFSNKEIARHLFISISTVKWHTSNILGKLGADNRTEAAAKARNMGLIK